MRRAHPLAPLLLLAWAWSAGAVQPALAQGLAQEVHEQARRALAEGRVDEARALFLRVLERDPRHLQALHALALLEQGAERSDEALEHAGRFLSIWRHLEQRPAELLPAHKQLSALAASTDPHRRRAEALRREHVTRLLKLAGEQMDHLAWHSARALLLEAQATDPEHPEMAAGLARIEKQGGNELAVADETGGVDPLAGVTAEWIAKHDPLHAEWSKAWELSTEHYRIRTNAGYVVLKTVATAMEQVHGFYRQFHRFRVDGGAVPVAGVHLYRNADEYKRLGGQPVEWAGGHWDGQNVVTYDARGGGQGSLAGMLATLFHEASHQFTSLAGGSAVPAWLNEGMASFFEGTALLSNGKLEWNLTVPGRLYPLVEDLRAGRNSVACVIEGQVDDYRVYYPWGWGIVYYLYNAEAADGTLLYRALLPEYFQKYERADHLARFTEFFVTRPRVSGIGTLAQFEAAFKEFILRLAAQDRGLVDAARGYEERGDAQLARGDPARAIELYERALRQDPGHPEVLWKLAAALEAARQGDRAAGTLRAWLAATMPAAGESDTQAPRRAEALQRIVKLDTSARRLEELRARFFNESLALARDYDAAGFPRLALAVLRGPATAQPPSEAARELYFGISDARQLVLERWRLIFDEHSLKGFYDGGAPEFEVQGGVLRARIGAAASAPVTGGGPGGAGAAPGAATTDFGFQRLFIDVQPSGDWSLSAQIQLGEGARMAGLCFGKKADGLIHGVVLLPQGTLDLAAFGLDGRTLQRVRTSVGRGWHELRIDTAGTRLVARLDGERVLEHEFATRAALRGDFGLLAGEGQSAFKEIRLLEFDPGLPRRERIGRRGGAAGAEGRNGADGAAASIARAAAERPAYLELAPPLLAVQGWIGEPPGGGDLDALRGWPVLLVFWTTYQERALPQLPGLVELARQHERFAIPILLLSNESREALEAWAAEHPPPFPIGYDHGNALYAAYAIPTVQLPHAKLLRPDGTVAWEGNPDYKEGLGTYLDEPLAELVRSARLEELLQAGAVFERGRAAQEAGDFAAASRAWRSLDGLEPAHPAVIAARAALEQLELSAQAEVARAGELERAGRILQALRLLESGAPRFEGLEARAAAAAGIERLRGSAAWRKARPMENRLTSAEKSLEAGKLEAARESLAATQVKLEGAGLDPWLMERTRWLLEALPAAADGRELLRRYREAFPELVP